jgi:hypothetical protein
MFTNQRESWSIWRRSYTFTPYHRGRRSEGFPASLIGQDLDGVEMKVVDGSLRIRSRRTARASMRFPIS